MKTQQNILKTFFLNIFKDIFLEFVWPGQNIELYET